MKFITFKTNFYPIFLVKLFYSDHTSIVILQPNANAKSCIFWVLGLLYRDDIETLFSLWPNAMYVYVDCRYYLVVNGTVGKKSGKSAIPLCFALDVTFFCAIYPIFSAQCVNSE